MRGTRSFMMAVLALFAVIHAAPVPELSSIFEHSPANEGAALVLSETTPGPGVHEVLLLSEFEPSLQHTAFDTPIFVLGQAESKPVIVITAGSHANEPAGVLAAYWLIERCHVEGARLLVLPRANAAAALWNGVLGGSPCLLELGQRIFRYGARLSDPAKEGDIDPPWYVPPHADTAVALPGYEIRNLNRVYPGNPAGSLTARTAWAITRLLHTPGLVLAIDLHEAGPESGLANSILARSEYLESAAHAALALESRYGLSFRLERSGPSHAGYSHWEWGSLGVPSFLIETLNPVQNFTGLPDPCTDTLQEDLVSRIMAQLRALEELVHVVAGSHGSNVQLHGMPSDVQEVLAWLNGSLL